MTAIQAEGWYWLPGKRKAHYAVGNKTLCGQWVTHSLVPCLSGQDQCKECEKKLVAHAKENQS